MMRMQKKQAGFTILEIGIVMIILVSLVVAFSSNLWEKQKAADIQLIKLWFTKNVPEAITICRMKYGNNLEGIDGLGVTGAVAADTALVNCGLEDATLYGGTWSSLKQAGTVTTLPVIAIEYDLTGMSDYANEESAIVNVLTLEGGVLMESVSFTDPNLVVEVRIR